MRTLLELLLAFALGASLFYIFLQAGHVSLAPMTITYSELVTILLAAVTIVMTALAVVIATISFIGYRTIRAYLRKEIEQRANRVVSEDRVQQYFDRAVERYMRRGVPSVFDSEGDDADSP